MLKKNYLPLISSLYFNYIFQGMAAIILAQNMDALKEYWQASMTQITLVMSAIGLGRALVLYYSGYFSDRFGRKKTVLIALLSYAIFFIGLLVSRHYLMAIFFALFGGISNAFLDTSTYPTLVEAYPEEKINSALSVLNKAFISLGQFILPFLTRFLLSHHLFFGWTFIMCTVFLMLNMVFLYYVNFPPLTTKKTIQLKNNEGNIPIEKTAPQTNIGNFKVDGIALLVFSFVSVSIFNIFILWIPKYAEVMEVASREDSLTFVSIYSVGSFLSVFLTAAIVRKGMNIPKLILVCLIFSASALLFMLLIPTFLSIVIASLTIGVFAAGGIWQLGLALMLELFPNFKGKYTSYYSLATAIAIMLTPFVTGILSEWRIAAIFWFNFSLVLLGLLAAFVIHIRYQQFFPKNKP